MDTKVEVEGAGVDTRVEAGGEEGEAEEVEDIMAAAAVDTKVVEEEEVAADIREEVAATKEAEATIRAAEANTEAGVAEAEEGGAEVVVCKEPVGVVAVDVVTAAVVVINQNISYQNYSYSIPYFLTTLFTLHRCD